MKQMTESDVRKNKELEEEQAEATHEKLAKKKAQELQEANIGRRNSENEANE